MKINKGKALATVVGLIMSPVILAGVLFRPIKLYFDGGMEIADELGKEILKVTDKWYN